jgi:hypothetical protein
MKDTKENGALLLTDKDKLEHESVLHRQREDIQAGVSKAMAEVFAINTPLAMMGELQLRGYSIDDIENVRDTLLRGRVLGDPLAQALFPDIAAEVRQKPDEVLKRLEELRSRIPRPTPRE